MQIGLFYFSGTGNTRFMAEVIKRELEKRGSTVELIPMENYTKTGTSPDLSAFNLIGIGFPVHAFDAPSLVYSFLKLLPIGKHHYFLFKTAGDKFLFGGSTRRLRMALEQKGWKLLHESFYEMPANMASKVDDAKNEVRTKKACSEAEIAVEQITAGERIVLPDSGVQRTFSIINRFESRGCRKGSRLWITKDNCIHCGKCVRECPTENISEHEGSLVFGDKCIFCLRCWWNCPVRALEHPFAKHVMLKEPYKLPEM